ncbi:MAG TPA: hypothetical protein VGI05_14280 [Streptosporangiaceae bacterium]
MTAIWGSGADGQWRSLVPSGYPAEAALHDLVQRAPQMLPLAGSPRLTVLGREVRLGTGYADLLAVDSTGRLVIIEVKLAGNAESRRAVVAQVLSYAGYLQGLDPEQLESQILGASVLAAVQAGDQQHAVDPEDFRDGLARSLADGSFRLVIVLDSAPDELVQVVGYLQSVTDMIDIDLVTVAAYDVAGSQVLVPQRIDPGRRVRELSDAQVTARQATALHRGSAEFRAVIAELPPAQREVLARLADWADTLEQQGLVKLATYRGKGGITSLLPRLVADDAGLVSIYCENGAASMQFWRSVFERRTPHAIPAVQAALGTELKQGNATHEFPEVLLEALTRAYQEAAATP